VSCDVWFVISGGAAVDVAQPANRRRPSSDRPRNKKQHKQLAGYPTHSAAEQ
jgi:hypothetical protein